MEIAQERTFSPVVSVVKMGELEMALEVTSKTEYGLSFSVDAKEFRAALKAIEKLVASITYVNASTIGAESNLTFSGVKHMGNGVGGGIHGIREFNEPVYIDHSERRQRPQIDTYRGQDGVGSWKTQL